MSEPAVAVAVLSLIAAVLGAAVTGFFAYRTKKVEERLTPYEKLAQRILDLEDADAEKQAEIDRLRTLLEDVRRESRVDRDWIARAWQWIDVHKPGTYPPPLPPPWLVPPPATTPEGHG